MDISIEFESNKLTIPHSGCDNFIKSYNNSDDIIFNDMFNLKSGQNMNANSSESSTVSLDDEIKKNVLWEESNCDYKKIDTHLMNENCSDVDIAGYKCDTLVNDYPNESSNPAFESVNSQFFCDNRYYQSYIQSEVDDAENTWGKIEDDAEKSSKDNNITDFNNDNIQKVDLENCNYIQDDSKQSGTVQEDSKQSDANEVVPIMNSFLNMENSNNAIDNNISTATSKCSSNHTFKLPYTEFSFNGRIKHLQRLNPNSDIDYKNKSKFDLNSSSSNPRLSNEIEISTANITDDSNQSETTSSPSNSLSDGVDTGIHMQPQSPQVLDYETPFPKETNDSVNTSFYKEITEFTKTSKLSLLDSESNTSKTDDTVEIYSLNGIGSPDIFYDDEYDCTEKSKTDPIDTLYEKFNNYDKIFIKKLERVLQGVPPPPSITQTQLTASEILNLYNSNIEKYNTISKVCEEKTAEPSNVMDNMVSTSNLHDSPPTIGHINSFSTYEIAAEAKWPDILHSRYYGLHYNYTADSEDIDLLLMRCLSRYVGSETSSSCVAAIKLRTPAKKSLRSTVGCSPGRRLSHLARRRIMYYKAINVRDPLIMNRQVLVDKKKYAAINIAKMQSIRRSPRLKRTPVKVTPKKKTPKSKTPKGKCNSASKKQSRNSNTKCKALFMNTENTDRADIAPELSMPSTSKLMRSKRALFISPLKDSSSSNLADGMSSHASQDSVYSSINSDRKRIKLDNSLLDPSALQRVKLTKSFSFGGDKIENNSQEYNVKLMPRYASEHFPNKVGELSDVHKKKLLWAVAEALRAHDIGVKHENFRLYMSSLARLTRKLSALPQHAHLLRTPGNSTSDTLLKIARQHSFTIIRGKSVDQIFSEEQLKQTTLRSTKVNGYVPINRSEHTKSLQMVSSTISSKYNENSFGGVNNSKFNTMNGTKTVLQDKTVNIDTKSSTSLSKSVKCVTTKNKLLACRHINFDNFEESSSR